MTPELGVEGVIQIFQLELSTHSLLFSLHIGQLRVSVLITVRYKRKLLLRGLRDTLICGYSGENSGISLIIVPDSPLGPIPLSATCF